MCVLGGVTGIQQPDHSSLYQNQNLYVQYHYKRNTTGEVQIYFGAISKTMPFLIVKHAIWKCTPYDNFLLILNFTSLMSLLPFF